MCGKCETGRRINLIKLDKQITKYIVLIMLAFFSCYVAFIIISNLIPTKFKVSQVKKDYAGSVLNYSKLYSKFTVTEIVLFFELVL